MKHRYSRYSMRRGARQQATRRVAPSLLRPATARPSRLLAIIGGTLAVLLLLGMLLGLGAAGVAYSAYAGLAASLKDRVNIVEQRTSFQTTRIYDRNGVLLYEFFGAGKRTRVPLAD